MDYRRWFRNCIIIFATAILAIFLAVLVVDPYFHYHAPIGKYRLYEPRFTNDGISRNFDFDAVIMGTSMSQNFKPSLADELFGLNTVKMPLVGASYKELSNQAVRVLKRNPKVKAVTKSFFLFLEREHIIDIVLPKIDNPYIFSLLRKSFNCDVSFSGIEE